MKRSSVIILLTLVLILALSGCFYPRFPDMLGSWEVTFSFEDSTRYGSFEITHHYGYNFSGSFCEDGQPCRDFFGLLFNGGGVAVYTRIEEGIIDFNGTISKGIMSGTFILHDTSEEGSWNASKK